MTLEADIYVTLTITDRDLAKRLETLWEYEKKNLTLADLANYAMEIDKSVQGLLQSFDKNDFWSAFSKIGDFHSYDENEINGTLYTFKFNSVEYPYANIFADQLETWMHAIGCINVFVEVRRKFSQSTSFNIFNVGIEYSKGSLAIFFGAGVSSDLGLPLWPELLKKLVKEWEKKGSGSVSKKLSKQNLEEQASFLKRKLGDEFSESVKQALYSDIYRNGIPSSPIFDSISKMDKLRAICTYNYDDLLERHAGPLVKTIATPSTSYSCNEIPVYHVHGLLPYVGSAKGELIITESDYHRLFNDQTHWANVIQLHLLRECTCLLIGISLSDRNLRRILDLIGKNKSGDTYIIQKMEDIHETDHSSITAWKESKEFDSESYSSLNVSTIWIYNYQEIPSILSECV